MPCSATALPPSGGRREGRGSSGGNRSVNVDDRVDRKGSGSIRVSGDADGDGGGSDGRGDGKNGSGSSVVVLVMALGTETAATPTTAGSSRLVGEVVVTAEIEMTSSTGGGASGTPRR